MHEPHEQDLVRIDGFGIMSRRLAREEAIKRFTQTGALIQRDQLPIGFVDLATAFLAAANGPAWEEYESPDPVTFTD